MGGPSLAIYTPKPITDDQRKHIEDLIKCISSNVKGEDFWIGGQPMSWTIEEPDDLRKEINIDGWSPKSEIVLGSFTNSHSAHVLLAMLAIKIAEITQGFIDLDIITTIVPEVTELMFAGWKYTKWFYGDEDLPVFIVEPKALANFISLKEFCLVK